MIQYSTVDSVHFVNRVPMSFLNPSLVTSMALRDRPSPHKLALCALLKLYTEPRDEDGQPLADPVPLAPLEMERLSAFLHREVHGTDRSVERSFPALQAALEAAVGGAAGGALAEQLRSILEEACVSPDALQSLVASLEDLLRPASSMR